MSTTPASSRPRLLVLELWGLGDLALATTLLQAATRDWEITLVAKPYAEALLGPSFPNLKYETIEAPWTAHHGKYRLLQWPWKPLSRLLVHLRAQHFDAAVSVRADPRDHLLMLLAGAQRRIGFPRAGSRWLLTDPIMHGSAKQHKVQDWRALAGALRLPSAQETEPGLAAEQYHSPRIDELLGRVTKPIICFHPGAKITVRRWPEPYFEKIIQQLRAEFDFHLVLVPDLDGYGGTLASMAETVLPSLTLGELVDVLGRSSLLLGNDSGPAHIAAATGRPVIAIFGPQLPIWFGPWGDRSRAVARDICPLRPCFDYCPYPEPYCLTKLRPEETWPEIRGHILHLISQGVLPRSLQRRESEDAPAESTSR